MKSKPAAEPARQVQLHCLSFGAYVTRFARACGAGAICSRDRKTLDIDCTFSVGRESIQMIDAEVARLFERAQEVQTA